MSDQVNPVYYGSYESVPLFLSVMDVANVLQIPGTDAYYLFHASDFPTITIGGRMLVRKEKLFHWLEQHPMISLSKKR